MYDSIIRILVFTHRAVCHKTITTNRVYDLNTGLTLNLFV